MVQAIAAQFPIFAGGESCVLYQPSKRERYLPVAPGIEVSVSGPPELNSEVERGTEASVYSRTGHLDSCMKKGLLVDTHL